MVTPCRRAGRWIGSARSIEVAVDVGVDEAGDDEAVGDVEDRARGLAPSSRPTSAIIVSSMPTSATKAGPAGAVDHPAALEDQVEVHLCRLGGCWTLR